MSPGTSLIALAIVALVGMFALSASFAATSG